MLTSLAPIPVATLSNREVGGMGQNYLKSLFAVGFQGMLILVCVGIYAVLVQGIADLVLVFPDHLELLDYKTDRRKSEDDFLAAYHAQLDLYALAISKRFAPKPVTYKGIYSLELGKLIEVK
jgi:ATP-dependent exoDNAse (exonuclease V) beta subunit